MFPIKKNWIALFFNLGETLGYSFFLGFLNIFESLSKVKMKIDNSMVDIYKDIKQIKRSSECPIVAMINDEKPLVYHENKS
jgi:hypothetical protein